MGKLFIYSNTESSIGQYGDWSGWNLLPWQLELDTMFLHANCAQMNELHYLRAELLRHLKLNRFKNVSSYTNRYPKADAPFKMRISKNMPVRKRTYKRFFGDHLFFGAQRIFWIVLMLSKTLTNRNKMSKQERIWFWKNIKVYPIQLLG